MLRVTVVKSEVEMQKEIISRHIYGLIKALGLRENILRLLHQDL